MHCNFIKLKGKKVKIKKEKYETYLDHQDFEPQITVCYLWLENGDVARGISVCSEDDEFDEMEGKSKARTFACAAIKGKETASVMYEGKLYEVPLGPFKRKEAVDMLIRCRCLFTKKAEKNPDLSWWERFILFGRKKMDNYRVGKGYKEPVKGRIGTNISMYKTIDGDWNNAVAVSGPPLGVAGRDISKGDAVYMRGDGFLV